MMSYMGQAVGKNCVNVKYPQGVSEARGINVNMRAHPTTCPTRSAAATRYPRLQCSLGGSNSRRERCGDMSCTW